MPETSHQTILLSELSHPKQSTQSFPSHSVPSQLARDSSGFAHDARNMLSAMDIYCDLLAADSVLRPEHMHYLGELRLLREAAARLLDRLIVEAAKNRARQEPGLPLSASRGAWPHSAGTSDNNSHLKVPVQARLIRNLRAELEGMLPMLSALAGPRVQITTSFESCPTCGLYIPLMDLTRALINLVRNAAEAMPSGGHIHMTAASALSEGGVVLSIEDNGPGIPLALLESVFDTPSIPPIAEHPAANRLSFRPRGLGLRIVRECVEQHGGSIRAVRMPERGSRFEIILPLVTKVREGE